MSDKEKQTKMTTTTNEITIYSEDGDNSVDNEITISIDKLTSTLPITLFIKGLPAFSMGSNEIQSFIEALKTLDPEN